MASDMKQERLFPDEGGKEKPEPHQPKKMTLGPEKDRGATYQICPQNASGSLLLLSSRQPSPHIRLMLFMEMDKEVTRFDRLSFQPRKMARWIAEDFIG